MAVHQHVASIRWSLPGGADFAKGRYSRAHTWTFDGGITVPASPSPAVVPAPWSSEEAVDPEEAFVAAIASCHMLTFLWLAHRGGFEVTAYEDDAVGVMTKNAQRVPWVSLVTLRPRVAWGARRPSAEEAERLHHDAHAQCFIAASVKTEIRVEPADATPGSAG